MAFKSKTDLTPDELADVEAYLNFFNTMGILVERRALDKDIIWAVWPYRIVYALDMKVTKEILDRNAVAWNGLTYLRDQFDKKSPAFKAKVQSIRVERQLLVAKSRGSGN